MQTRTYGDLFKLIQSLAGVSTFAPTETDDIANLINRRYSEAYQTIQMWPRYLVSSEERNLSSFKLEGTTDRDGLYYKYATFTYTTGKTCDFFVPVNQNNSNKTNVCFFKNTQGEWVLGTYSSYQKDAITNKITSALSPIALATQQDEDSDGNVIEYDSPTEVKEWGNLDASITSVRINAEQGVSNDETFEVLSSATSRVSKDTIGEFIRVHRNRAFLNNSALEYDFYVNSDGANILNISNSEDTSVFVTYKKKFTPFTTSSEYTTSTEEVPSEFFHYIAHAAYSDFLRMDGQHDKAQLEQQNAQQYLALELERVDVIMNQTTVNKRFSTYVNRQSR